MEEFKVKAAPKTAGKKLSVFRMHKDDHVSWAEAKMKRENEYQPWQIKTGSGRTSKRFKANKVGSVDENSDFFIFYKPKNAPDTFEVCPVDEWYNVAADKRYKTLTAEEAEEKYMQRNKTLNYFSVMHMKKNGEGDGDEGGYSASDSKSFKISEMDEWDRSDDDFSGSDAGDDDETGAKRRGKKKSIKKEKGDDDAPEEGKEDSDEGDFEQREVDYMSESSSDSDLSNKGEDRDKDDVKGIDEEQALRDLLDSEEEGEDAEGSPVKGAKSPAIKSPSTIGQDLEGNESGDSESSDNDDDDYEVNEDEMESMFMKKSLPAALVKQETKVKQEPTTASSSTPSQTISSSQKVPPNTQQGAAASKRKITESAPPATGPSTSAVPPPPKRPCPPEYSSSAPPNSIERTIEDLIKKYLSRKPTTLKMLLRDIKAKLKRMGGADVELDKGRVHYIAEIIKKLNPEKKKINNDTYLSLKS